MRLTTTDVRRIRELRAMRYTHARIAAVVGCSKTTAQRYAPGRPGKVPVAPLREAFLASSATAGQVAWELGWDPSKVKRTLGLLRDVNGNGYRSYRTMVDAETVERIADAIGISPWSVLPDDESEAAA